MKTIQSHRELHVYQKSFAKAMEIFTLSKSFPMEERYSLTDQIRRSSRSVSSNTTEAFRKRRYTKSFISKLSDAEGEAAETQTWLEFAYRSGYIEEQTFNDLYQSYDEILGMLVKMINNPEVWSL